MAKRNIYKHSIELKILHINNQPRLEFAKSLEEIPYRGYEVEQLSDGKKVVITKPGGKRSMFGQPKKEDFLVYLYDENDSSLWQITHQQIREQIIEIGEKSPTEGVKIIDALEFVFNGEEPNEVLKRFSFTINSEISPEAVLKLYKWIWGQEDVNYPNKLGRNMVWYGKEYSDGEEVINGSGYSELRDDFKSKL